ncbi:MmpS family transport accessory protein [Mycolicibacterium frederiksbergense]|uniref:MmpS family transport accessory protein n=1 Tax=Mycolicibacterium frederiksbergense TaxID=117567 RepID=UPI00399A684A
MTDSPRRDEPTQRLDGGHSGYSGYPDPAYSGQPPYGVHPTEKLPAYPAYGYDQYGGGSYGGPPPPPGAPPPEPPGTPRWLWIVAAVAVVTVIGLVIALVIVNSSQQQTVVAPVPTLSEPSIGEPTLSTAPPTTTRRPTTTSRPAPTTTTTPSVPGGSAVPGATESVTYNVTGEGRAINVTYVDDGGVLQTEFNVLLPWSKTVNLAQPAKRSASVTIINVGREVNCSISIDGAEIQQRTGSGLTICSPIG